MTDCPHCAADSPEYNWESDCCCARFIAHIPDKTIRIGWLNRWLIQFGAERTEHIKKLVAEAWARKVEENKQAVMGFGK